MPLHDCNTILLAAGYALRYSEVFLDTHGCRASAQLQRLLKQNEPFPAVVDRHWNVLLAASLMAAQPAQRNLLRLAYALCG